MDRPPESRPVREHAGPPSPPSGIGHSHPAAFRNLNDKIPLRMNRPDGPARQRRSNPPGPWRRPGRTPVHRRPNLYTILQMDVAGSARRDSRSLRRMRDDLFDLVEEVALDGGVDLESLPYDDHGDGLRLLLPPDVPPPQVIDVFAGNLEAGLREHRRQVDPSARIRLRVSFHIGLVTRHRGSWTGSSLVVAARLVQSKPLRAALRMDDEVNLAAAVSDPMYQLVVRDRFDDTPLTCYRKVRVRVKEYDDRAWLLVPRSEVCAVAGGRCAAHDASTCGVGFAVRKGGRR
jgi:class 3 adenylate cyclase